MDVNGGGFNGPVAQEGLDGEQVRAIFVKIGAESMVEGMAGEPLRPAKAPFMGMDVPGEEMVSMVASIPDCLGKSQPLRRL